MLWLFMHSMKSVRFQVSNRSRFWLSCLGNLVDFLPMTFKLFGFPIFWLQVYLIMFIPGVMETKLDIYIFISIFPINHDKKNSFSGGFLVDTKYKTFKTHHIHTSLSIQWNSYQVIATLYTNVGGFSEKFVWNFSQSESIINQNNKAECL